MKNQLLKAGKSLWLMLLAVLFYTHSVGQELMVLNGNARHESQVQTRQQTLKEVLKEMEAKYRIYFVYSSELLDNKKVDTENIEKNNIEKYLTSVLSQVNLKVQKISDSNYAIVPEKENINKSNNKIDLQEKPIKRSSEQRGTYLNKLEKFNMSTLSSTSLLQAQTITGKVTSEEGESLPGVNVVIKGTQTGTITDVEGIYRISANPDDVLQFSYVGYTVKDLKVGNRSTINVQLVPDVQQLEELVVVGYGAQKKSDLTGAISSVKTEDLLQAAPASLDEALQGQAAGVQVSMGSGAPGSGVSIRIRGGNSLNAGNEPLYVIDGFPVINDGGDIPGGGANPLATINPNDIQSIEVLKDASATAIYGARGANGVIMITTKRGSSGKTNIDFQYFTGIEQVSNLQPLANLQQQVEMQNEAQLNSNGEPYWYKNELDSMYNYFGGTGGTEWQNAIMRTGVRSSYNLAFTGGTEAVRYAITGNHFRQDGVIKESGFKRYSFRSNLDAKLTEKLDLGTNLSVAHTSTDIVPTGGPWANVMVYATRKQPYSPVYVTEDNKWLWEGDQNIFVGNYAGRHPIGEGGSQSNPLAEVFANERISLVNRVLGNLFADYEIMEGLRARVSFGASLTDSKRNEYTSSQADDGARYNGIARIYNAKVFDLLNENTVTYMKSFGEHSLNILGGFTWQQNTRERFDAEARGFVSDGFSYNNLGAGIDVRRPNSDYQQYSLASFIFRTNYIFKNKYYITFTSRADGASRFGPANKWAIFPSGSLAWRLADENFIQNLEFFDELKLRLSYGLSGNSEIGSYRSITRYNDGLYTLDGINEVSAIFVNRVGNESLQWEKTSQLNLGMDVGFFRGRVMATLDYYKKNTSDLLLELQLPYYTGFNEVMRNVGSISNEGFEVSLNTQNITSGKFRWQTTLNWSANKNRVEDLYNTEEILISQDLGNGKRIYSIIKEGYPVGTFYGPIFDGIYQNDEEIDFGQYNQDKQSVGMQRYLDANGDGRFNSNDFGVMGFPTAKFFYGMTNRVNYGAFDLRVFINGVYGNDILNANRIEGEDMFPDHRAYATVMNRWQLSNPTETMPAAGRNYSRSLVSSQHVEDGSYIRLRNLTLGYNLPTQNLNWLRSLRLYAAADNLLTFTKYSGYDPEVNAFGNNTQKGVDLNVYPMPQTYRIGVDVGF